MDYRGAVMKLSLQWILIVLSLVNSFYAGMGVMRNLIQSSEESERMASVPADWRYRLPRDSEADTARRSPTDSAIHAKLVPSPTDD